MWKDKLFWFAQPAGLLNIYDNYLFWLFVGLGVVGIIIKFLRRLNRHPIVAKCLNKFANAFFWTGIIGLIWFGFRYENTPIFADRLWAGLILGMLLIWLGFVFKYLFGNFREEKSSFDKLQLNSRYVPGSKK